MVSSVFVIFASGCDILYPDEELSLKRTDYTGNELRTDGYYYSYNYNGNTYLVAIRFLYRNGIVYNAFVRDANYDGSKDINEVEKEMIEHLSKYYSRDKKIKSNWGVFVVDGNKIQLERWTESPSGVSLSTYKYSGYIENDTTLRFTKSYYSGRDETKKEEYIYHFKQFDNKPDSTNAYIY
jgi:hypothetical protein